VPWLEISAGVALIAMLTLSYTLFSRQAAGSAPLTPPLVATLLVFSLAPAILLLVLLGRRIAKRRAARSPVGGGGRLHVRLVAIFSTIASVPMLLVVVFASLLFQYGVEFWFSDRARGMLENASSLAQGYYAEKQQAVASETVTMAGDLRDYLQQANTQSPAFAEGYAWQVLSRNLSESAIVEVAPNGTPRTIAMVNPDARPVERRVSAEVLAKLQRGSQVAVTNAPDRIEAVTRLYPGRNIYLYASRVADRQALTQSDRAKAVLADYDSLVDRSRRLQLQFNAALFFISLLIVGLAVWIALQVADRLVRPVGELVDAARRVTKGDLAARVPSVRSRDEIGTLSNAFNRMTARLEAQTTTLETRRALIEAVLSGVSAGVVAVAPDRSIRIVNDSAVALLGLPDDRGVGRPLATFAPELDQTIIGGEGEAIVELTRGGETRTLAVRVVADEQGRVLTFDDITQQLTDQRRAAWADVARRIAHEIKNPLTPISLAAERLKRRYSERIGEDDGTFIRLTDTIVRQVGDLRRMVDEFSSFARMPKPVFQREPMFDICREALFLHEVAHPGVSFELDAPDHPVTMVCDRRQLGQALTNIVKNAVEAIEQKDDGPAQGAVRMALTDADGRVTVSVEDTGIGLPEDRERLFEPYVTNRPRGTGLGLAIVKKIVEEHFGTIALSPAEGGGTMVTINFDAAALAACDGAEAPVLIPGE
jgi:two-component system nitrogen regulation sensor histidine kinase NtrY